MSQVIKLGMEDKKFAYDKDETPAARIHSGDTVVLETEDANCSLITKETDLWPEFKKIYEAAGGCNPVAGPIYVEEAKAGDFLAVEILNVVPGFLRNGGYTSIQSGVGILEDINGTIQKPLEAKTRICHFEDGKIIMKSENPDEHFEIPLNPFVGSIGVAPAYDRRSSFCQGEEWCGNIDLSDVRVGATVILPVNVDGGLLLMGDVHGCQGDGEITGCALECQGIIEAKVTVLKKGTVHYFNCPQVNTEEWIGSIGIAGGTNASACMKRGYTDLVRRMEAEYGIDPSDGYMLLNLAGKVLIGNEKTCLCKIDKKLLKKYADK